MSKIDRPIWGWAMHAWANSAFATVVMAGFFPVFFKQFWNYGTDVNLSTARLGLANSIASLCVAVMAPVLVGGVSLGVSRLMLPPAAGPAQIRQTAHLAARWGIASVLLLLLAGAVLLCFVDERRGRAEAAELTTSGAPPAA